ncbi:MAG: branched-chain amino acid ABC transporter permease [Burkholderiaceae bacterium]|nr:MAG: branched-chain amino acid ABC transporter permease [Burkholderiaceae bacterium]
MATDPQTDHLPLAGRPLVGPLGHPRVETIGMLGARSVCILLLIAAPFLLNDFSLLLLTEILIFGLFGASLDLLIGFTGLPSLGHAAYYGFGAYVAALFAMHVMDNVVLALLIGTAAGAISAALTGWVTVRTRGVYFLMITVAITEIVYSLAVTWTDVTGGSNGLTVSTPMLVKGLALDSRQSVYWYVLIVVIAGYAFVRAIGRSPLGRTLNGIRENEPRMRAIGYSTARYKFAIYCVAGAVAGAAGALGVVNTGFVSPSDASFTTAALAFIAVIVGGSGTLYGAFLGAIVVILVRDEFSTLLPGRSTLVLGVIFIVAIYLFPKGIAGGLHQLRQLLQRLVRHRRAGVSDND